MGTTEMMNATRWSEIERLYHVAPERTAEERSADEVTSFQPATGIGRTPLLLKR